MVKWADSFLLNIQPSSAVYTVQSTLADFRGAGNASNWFKALINITNIHRCLLARISFLFFFSNTIAHKINLVTVLKITSAGHRLVSTIIKETGTTQPSDC